jgi:hypothetical protein
MLSRVYVMKRLFLLLGLAGLLLVIGDGHGGPVAPFPKDEPELSPLAGRDYTREFQGGKRATVLAIGDGATYMGLYVYDAQGNCIAWDDEGNPRTCDDLAVTWTPRDSAFFTVEVRNAGLMKNKCQVYMH